MDQAFLVDIQSLSKLIKNKGLEDNETIKAFEDYCDKIGKMGPFSRNEWTITWRRAIYKFGELFKKRSAGPIIDVLNKKIDDRQLNSEPLHFILSEVTWNFFPKKNREYCGQSFRDLFKKYPSNPEFHHSYANYLHSAGNFDKAINEFRIALKIEPSNNDYLIDSFNAEKMYIDHLISHSKINDAEKVVDSMRKNDAYASDQMLNNLIISFKDRIADHRLIEDKLSHIDDKVAHSTEKERRKLIEVLGFFTAILSFVFVGFNSALTLKLSFANLLSFMLGMSLILIMFSASISILFSSTSKSLIKDRRLWLIIILILIFLIWIALEKYNYYLIYLNN